MRHHKYYVLGLNDEPHNLDPSDPGYDSKLAAYNKGIEDQDSDIEESQVGAIVEKLLEG